MTDQNDLSSKRLATVNQIPKIKGYEWLSANAIRHIIFAGTVRHDSKGKKIPTNGLDQYGAIIRIGRKVLIDLDAFDRWVEKHREVGGENNNG